MATHARQQYFADESSLSKEKREFSIAEEVQQKIDSIEEGAQVNTIETIKVNGSEVQPDENKAVDLTIPGVVDSLDSTSSTDALSAKQGKVLYDYIQDVSHIGHFLALWDASTGLPVTDPETSPYIYNTGDFYTVSVVASGGGTNYKPDGTQYVIGQASTAVETDDVEVNDFYFYDGTTWRHMKNSGAGSIAVDGSLSTTSTNPVENRVITNALNGKADATDINTKTFYLSSDSDLTTAQAAYDWYSAGKNPIIDYQNSEYFFHGTMSGGILFLGSTITTGGQYTGTSSLFEKTLLFNVSNGAVTSIVDTIRNNSISYIDTITPTTAFTPTYDWQPATKKYVDDHAGTTYTAGANIQISNENVISATDTTYTAGTNVQISNENVISATDTTYTAGKGISIGDINDYSAMRGPCPEGFHIPSNEERDALKTIMRDSLGTRDGTNWIRHLHMPLSGFRTQSGSVSSQGTSGIFWSSTSGRIFSLSAQDGYPGYGQGNMRGQSVRGFKDSYVEPDSTWTVALGTLGGAGIFWNQSEGLISITNGSTGYTIMDKNLGATTVYNDGDTLTEANMGYMYQWGNNYGFPSTGTISGTSSTKVDASGYGPGNYYESNTFITGNYGENRDTSNNANLRGGVTGVVTFDNAITNIGVTSINGQTGDVVLNSAEWGNITGTLSDQTDLQNALDEKVNLGLNKVFDSTTVEIGKWVDEGGMQGSGHHVTIDPNGEVSAYNVTSGGYNEAKLGTDGLTLLENSALGGDETTVISQDGITVTEGQTTQTYNFLGNDRIAKLSDISGISDLNTKTFYLLSTSDLTTAQAILDWYNAGKNPIIVYNNGVKPNTYTIFNKTSTRIDFRGEETPNDTTDHTQLKYTLLTINFSGTTASSITLSTVNQNYLATDISYPSAYIPTYDSSPATKKYVDDNINTKTFYAAGQSDWNTTLGQSVYDWIKDGNYAILHYGVHDTVLFLPTNTTTGTITSEAYNYGQAQSNQQTEISQTYSMVVSNGIVTSTDASATVNGVGNFFAPGGTATTGYVVTKTANGYEWATPQGTTYNAGEGIGIGSVSDYSAMRGPAPIGYHVPQSSEWGALRGILTSTFSMDANATTAGTYLKMPMAGLRSNSSSSVSNVGSSGSYWSSAADSVSHAYALYFSSSSFLLQNGYGRSRGFSVRCFKNTPVIPDSNWITLYQGTGSAGVFRNSSLGLISVSGDGTTWYTIQDKNLGATTVYNQGDTLTDANCGYFYQWGNNYGFAHSGTLTTSSTQVDASSYGPGNYYSSSTFITGSNDWSSVQNDNLWGGVTGVVTLDNTITNTGVLSVNGQTGDVTIAGTNTKTFQGYRGIGHLDNAQAVYDRISTGKYAIVEVKNGDNNWKGNVVFGPTDVTTGTISSWEYTHADQSSLSGGLYYEEYNKLVMQVADGVVTQAYSSGEVIHNNGHLVVKGDTAPSGPIEGSMWYDTTNDKLKAYDGTNWNEVGAGDMNYADFNWQAKTGATVTLDLASTVTPTANFTVNAPSTIKDGQTYILRVNNGATAYTMTLGTNITNPYQESTLLTADGIDQFVFLAIGGNLELQPIAGASIGDYVESVNGTSGPVTLKTINNTSIVGSGNIAVQATLSPITSSLIKTGTSTNRYSVTAAALAGGLVRISSQANNILANGGKLWAGTQEDYEALTSYDEDTVYLTI